MTDGNQFLSMIGMLAPFVILAKLNASANLKKEERYKQFLMPILAIILCIVAMAFLSEIYDGLVQLMQSVSGWVDQLGGFLTEKLPANLSAVGSFVENLSDKLDTFIKSLNLNFWAFFIANAAILLAYVIVKKILLAFLRPLFRDGNLFQKTAALFYDYDEDDDRWYLNPKFSQARTFLKVMYVTAVALGVVGVLASSWLYLNEWLTALYYPVFSVIVLGELCFLLDGYTKAETKNRLEGEADTALNGGNYSIMRGFLRRLFGDKLAAENTTVSEVGQSVLTNDELLTELEASDDPAVATYGHYMRRRSNDGMELDFNYLLSGKQLLGGQSMLFSNPFYYDLVPYVFYPFNQTLLRKKKVLVVLGRHGAEEDVEDWCRKGFLSVTNTPDLWNIGLLSDKEQDLDVGIISRSNVHNLKLHEANRAFFEDVETVVLVEPSRLVTTAQIGLNSLVRLCSGEGKKLTFCSMDKNCDGLLDTLSHLLMTVINEVTATNRHKGASSYMIWEADGDYLQHRMLPNLSRYLGVGTELSFAALKNQVPETKWYGGDAFPVQDIHWIAKQYYYDLLHYANLPTNQETMDRAFQVSHNIWSVPMAPFQYLTVEDESYNMFEVKRAFSTRATDQGFVNVICSDYLLKDYMADNDTIFNADPKAIPYIAADYARTARNTVLRLCLRMSAAPVTESEICRELLLVDKIPDDPAKVLWQAICENCGYVGEASEDRDGQCALIYHTADGDVEFTANILVCKRRFNMETGKMENMYSITNQRFISLVLDALSLAEYIAEDENGKQQFLGTELKGHILQKYLPGQFFTFGGKYYEMVRLTKEGRVLVRRASDHINGRPMYRQIRNYHLSNITDSNVMGECRDLGFMRIFRQYADIRVQTPGYWKMERYNDFGSATRVILNGIPDRLYNYKSVLRVELFPEGGVSAGTLHTLVPLMNEVLRTLLAENQDYLTVVVNGEAQLPSTMSLSLDDSTQRENCFYIIEDSQMDIGLLDAVERNLNRIFEIVCDYLQWHEEKLSGPETPAQAPAEPGEEPEQTQPEPEPKGIKKVGAAIKKFFTPIGNWFKKVGSAIANFFRKLFKRKKTGDEDPTGGATEGTEEASEQNESLCNTPRAMKSAASGEDAGADGPVETVAGAGNDTLEFEKEQVQQPGLVFTRPEYKDRYYLRYGSEEIENSLCLTALKELLVALGFGNSGLTQSRKGKDVAEMVERSFVPNREGVHYCDFCGCELSGMDYDILGDGRERCPSCSRTAVKDAEEFARIHDSVMRNLKMFFGIRINAPVHIQMVNSKKLHKALDMSFVPTGQYDGRVLGVAIKDRNGYTILIENGAPRLQSTMTMVHELTHIWQYLHWDAKDIRKQYGDMELEVYEGMAKWVEIQYTYMLNEVEAAKREELITRCRQDAYGFGFVKYAEKYPMSIGGRPGGATPFDNIKTPL